MAKYRNVGNIVKESILKEFGAQEHNDSYVHRAIDDHMRLHQSIPVCQKGDGGVEHLFFESRDMIIDSINKRHKREYIGSIDINISCQNDYLADDFVITFDILVYFNDEKFKDDFRNKFNNVYKKMDQLKIAEKFGKSEYIYLTDFFDLLSRNKKTAVEIFGTDYKMKIVDEIAEDIIEYAEFEKQFNNADEVSISLARDGMRPIINLIEHLTDQVLSYKENKRFTKEYILSKLIPGNEVVIDDGDKLLIKLYTKNKDIMSEKWCITSSDRYWSQYNAHAGCIQHVLYNFETKQHIGFNLRTSDLKVTNAFDWRNSNAMSNKNLAEINGLLFDYKMTETDHGYIKDNRPDRYLGTPQSYNGRERMTYADIRAEMAEYENALAEIVRVSEAVRLEGSSYELRAEMDRHLQLASFPTAAAQEALSENSLLEKMNSRRYMEDPAYRTDIQNKLSGFFYGQ
jgi:hypothetical protein